LRRFWGGFWAFAAGFCVGFLIGSSSIVEAGPLVAVTVTGYALLL